MSISLFVMKASSYTCVITTLKEFSIDNFKSLITVLELVEAGSQKDSMFAMDASTTS